MRIAIQGERGSFSHQAARQIASGSRVLPCPSFSDVYDELARGAAQAAVVPVENTLAGSVGENLDLLLARDIFIQRECRLRISHQLIATPGVKLREIRRVFSHPVALDQCRDFFRHHRRIQAVPFYDTAGSVKHIIESALRDSAAIAGVQAAQEYGGRILQRGLEDDKQNFTRFFFIRRVHDPFRVGERVGIKNAKKLLLPGANKTSIAFALKNVAGALFKALSVFALRDISLSKIESRPVRGRPWEYVFFVDYLRGDDEPARLALRHLAEISDFVKILGIYPAT